MNIEALINGVVRDITTAGFMPKSEARRRLRELYELGYKTGWQDNSKRILKEMEQFYRQEQR